MVIEHYIETYCNDSSKGLCMTENLWLKHRFVPIYKGLLKRYSKRELHYFKEKAFCENVSLESRCVDADKHALYTIDVKEHF